MRAAHEMFTAMDADGSPTELASSRWPWGRRCTGAGGDARPLTAREAQIARLARESRTDAEIGSRIFISPGTVEWHLKNVFTKLGIGSRRELHDALPAEPPATVSA